MDPLDTRGDDKFVICHCQRVIHLFKTDWSPPAPAASTSARHAAWGRAAANAGATQKEAKDFSPMYFPSSLNPLEQQTQLQHSYNDWERIFDATTYVST